MHRLLPAITAERVPTSRLTTAVLSVTGRTGQPATARPTALPHRGRSCSPTT
jgi:hypothetical protein